MSTAVRERAWCVVIPHDPRGARLARQRFVGELRGLVPQELLGDAVTVVAELVGNAIQHARPLPGGVVRVAWRVHPGADASAACRRLDVWVTDGGAHQPPMPRSAGPDALDGRGLGIVAALASRWGVKNDGLGQCVWAELGMPEPAAPR